MFGMSGGEIVIILMIVLVFFGSKSMPKMARMLGRGMRQIKDASQDLQREIQNSMGDAESGIGSIAKDIRKPFEEMERPLSDIGKPFTEMEKPISDIGKPFSKKGKPAPQKGKPAPKKENPSKDSNQ
ncbi:MAG: twin-arginine translocase TatA/TatE family subunit [Flavobacteriales bacterium]|nr:twin-arginine translocase TatA/TatE family subunit [Flavobacteriales bacterium]